MVLLVWKTVSSDSQLILTFSWDGHGTISQSVTLFQLQKAQEAVIFFTRSNLISSTYLIWFKSLCHLRQFLDALLWSGGARTNGYTPPHKPLMLLTHKTRSNTQNHTYTHTAISGLKPGISMQFHFHIEDFVLRNSTKRKNANFETL